MKKMVLTAVLLVTVLLSACGRGGETTVSADRAKEIALQKVAGATQSDIREFEKDVDNGKTKFEGKIIFENTEYEFEIDASTGNILKWETESVFD